jgi:hypothetical protein
MIVLLLLALSATDYKDIAPILRAKCAPCHRPGEVAPFPLLTHAQTASHGKQIAAVVEQGIMPPWKAVSGDFEGSRALTAREKSMLLRWIRTGATKGAVEPPVPVFKEGWRLGEPDLVLEMPQAFEIPAEGADLYQCFVIPLGIERYVRAWEFQPGARAAVHHALFFTDGSKGARKRAVASGNGTYSCFGVPGFLPSGSLGGWSPGFAPFVSPPGTASRLQAGHDLVMQIHYHPTGKPETDRSRIGLYFAKEPPSRKIVDIGLVSRDIDIPAGEAAYKVRDHFTIPIDVEVTGIIPHAHYICKQMLGWATLPNGRKRMLLRIDDWDFNWQEQYRYRKPFVLPAGTRVDMEFTYDNSAANPRNPSRPPARVEWGPDTTDEMAGLHIQAIPVRMEEMPELGKALWGKIMRTVGGRFYELPKR